jgi:DNA-binding MarR family transcriptional regulator
MHVRELEDILGAPARLAVMATAMDGQRWTFTALGRETGLADGNLHVQTRKLTVARLLARERTTQGNRTVTCFEITEKGRRVFQEYVRRLRESAEQRTVFPGEKLQTQRPGDGSRVW